MIEQYVNTVELKRLVSTLLVFLGALIIAALFASIVVPGLRNANRPPVATPVNAVVGEPGWLDPAEFPPVRGAEVAPVDPKKLIADSPEAITRGKQLFAANCVQCHGDSGRGDGPAAATMNPRPRNFTAPQGWTNGYTLPAIYRTLSEGVKGTSMAPFDYLSKPDRMALAHYVQSLGIFSHDAGADEMRALSDQLASPGGRTPNKIPVSMAMAKLEQEFTPVAPVVADPSDHSPGAEIVRTAVTEPVRAGRTLRTGDAWRGSPNELAAMILPGTPENGFSVRVGTFTPAEWQKLFEHLSGLIAK